MLAVKARLEEDGVAVPEVSVGSTPTELSRESFEGITEIRPGNYVFLDRTQLRLGVCQEADCALFVLATVVSANDDYLIVDAGSKTLSSDAGAHGSGAPGSGLAVPLRGGPGLELVKLSEEHGFLRRDGRDLQVGERLLILPNHACPVANLADELSVVDTAGGCREWKVEARGRNR